MKSKFIKKHVEKAFLTDDAPSDNNAYLRNNNTWKYIETPISSISDVPNDNKIYDRKDNAWTIQDAKTRLFSGNVIGIELVSPGGGSGTWRNIDKDGVPIAFASETQRKSYFDNHPIWGNIKEDIIDGQYMIRIPKFYFKNDNHRKIWISPYKVDDSFKCHPAFMKNGEEMDCFWIGKYQGSVGNNKLCSILSSNPPTTNLTINSFRSYALNRNVDGIEGFCLNNIYMWAVIQFLFLIEYNSPDSNAILGPGITSGSSCVAINNLTNMNINYRNIVGIHGNAWNILDGIYTSGGKIVIFKNDGSFTNITTNFTISTTSTYYAYNTVYTDENLTIGFDMKDIFFPKSTSGGGSYGGLSYNVASSNFVMVGGSYGSSSNKTGIFTIRCYSSTSNAGVGSRLARL